MRFVPFLLAIVCLVVLFTGLDRTGVIDQFEARDAQVARELVSAREPITPLVGYEPLFEKPILAYAPEAAVRFVSGSPDFHSRLLRAIVGLLLVILTASIAAEHFGARAAWFAALILSTSPAFPCATRADGTQLFATLFGWLGCAGLADAQFGRRAGRDLRLIVAYGALAAALVCAGPLPALWPLAALAIYLALARVPDGWRRARPLAGLALMAGLALPWYGAAFERHGAAFLAHVPFFPYAAGPWGPWWVGPVLTPSLLVFGFFPWSSLLPEALLHAATRWRPPRGAVARPPGAGVEESRADPVARERREERAAHFFVACLIAALVPVAFYPRAPFSAALPALPAAALLCGRFLDHLFEDAERVARPLWRTVLMLALLATAGGIMLTMLARHVREAAPALRLLGTLVFLTGWAPFLASLIGRRRIAAALMPLPVVLGLPIVTMRILPAMEGYLNTREVAATLAAASPPRATLVLLEPPPPSLRLYSRRNLAVATELAPALERNRSSDGLAYVAFRPSREQDVARAAAGPLEILTRTPSMVLARVHPG